MAKRQESNEEAVAIARPQSPPWVPNGPRPYSPPKQRQPTAPVGTRRNKAVEHKHVFLDSQLSDESNLTFWLYGAYDYKMQTTPETARTQVFKIIDSLVERMQRMVASTKDATERVRNSDNVPGVEFRTAAQLMASVLEQKGDEQRDRSPSPQRRGESGAGANRSPIPTSHRSSDGPRVRAQLIFDLISTKKHIGADYLQGLPHQLGQDIYGYVDKNYSELIVTSFVGLTDNTARRAGRDVYYQKDDQLAKTHFPFQWIDNEHLFIIFPQSTQQNQQQQHDESSPLAMRKTGRTSPMRPGQNSMASPAVAKASGGAHPANRPKSLSRR